MESLPEKRRRARTIVGALKKLYPNPKSGLTHRSPFELLIKTILSAQCTDDRVNKVGESLFRKYRSPEDFVSVPAAELENDIRPTGFFRTKARNIQSCCRTLIDEYGGQIPDRLDQLIRLGGVGRKTANVILGNVFDQPAVVVDTHVGRLSRLLGFSDSKDPAKVELDLQKIITKKDWSVVSHLLILHGRSTCIARRPRCNACGVAKYCPSSNSLHRESI